MANPHDPHALRADEIAFHQWITTAPDAALLRRQLASSPLFEADEQAPPGLRFEWRRTMSEDESSPFPFARITTVGPTVLLEACAERRLEDLRYCLADLGFSHTSADQVRAIPVASALERPSVFAQPLMAKGEKPLAFSDIAGLFVRMAWAFLPHEGLSGRTPHVAIRTGRGVAALERVIEGLPAELESWHPSLSKLSRRELRDLLIPRPTETRSSPKEPHAAHDRRRN